MILKDQVLWTVMTKVIVLAMMDSLEANVMNVTQMLLVTSVTHAKLTTSTSRIARVGSMI